MKAPLLVPQSLLSINLYHPPDAGLTNVTEAVDLVACGQTTIFAVTLDWFHCALLMRHS
jgi:hypothetical protein